MGTPALAAAPRADLKVSSAKAKPSSVVAGGTVTVTARVRNAGRRKAPRTSLGLQLSRDRRPDAKDVRLRARAAVAPLRGRRARAVRLVARVPGSLRPGRWYVLACADVARRAKESKERNNCRVAGRLTTLPGAVPPVTPGGPGDLIAGSPGPGGSPAPSPSATPTPTPTATPTPTPSPTPTPGGALPAVPLPADHDVDPAPASGAGPDPEASAPAVSTTVATEFTDSTKFLYTGAGAVQTGVDAGAIEARRVSVLHGRVLTRSGQPLGGVHVTVLDHPELGSTLSQADGGYDLAVNGGGLVTVELVKDGYMAAQRRVDPARQDFATVEDVALVRYDPIANPVDLGTTGPIQVAQGSETTDGDGKRRATMMFPSGTTGKLELPDGSETALGDVTVRATEYTIGSRGEEAMPGDLPATSGYTYAVELSVDEAVEAGATKVEFSKPVAVHVDNFLNFPVGMAVPIGWYDREAGEWVPARDGKVIEVLASGGIDTDGDGSADSAAVLDAQGITAAERTRLAEIHPDGAELWRVAVTHFTPWDANWPYGPPDDAIAPTGGPDGPNPPDKPKPEKECIGDGSFIGCESQRLGESVPLTGTSERLEYWSDRTPGRVEDRALRIPLTGPSVPASLKQVQLRVDVAGRSFAQSFGGGANQAHRFVWDGKDGYGRSVQGFRPATISIGYVYGAVYQSPATGAFASSFGRFTSGTTFEREARRDIVIWSRWNDPIQGDIGTWDARAAGLGGWTLDSHHAYDPARRLVHLGGGGTLEIDPVVETIAGSPTDDDPNDGPLAPDGTPATDAALHVQGTALEGPDGRIYFDEHGNFGGKLRRIEYDGTLSTVADIGGGHNTSLDVLPGGDLLVGTGAGQRVYRVNVETGAKQTIVAGNGGAYGEGTPAVSGGVGLITDVAAAPDGSIYYSDMGSGREFVRRVDPEGRVWTVAGNGSRFGADADGHLATEAQLGRPTGIDVGPDGALYISDDGCCSPGRIHRVGVDGIIRTVAGGVGGTLGQGEGLPATDVPIRPDSVQVAPDGSLVFSELGSGLIRSVRPDGTLRTLAGGGPSGVVGKGEGGPARRAALVPWRTTVMRDGGLLFTEYDQPRIRKVDRPLPETPGGVVSIPARDGSEIYRFDGAGRHLETRDGLTGVTLRTFAYTGAGLLTSMTDTDGLVTVIERGGGGLPAAIVAPGGQRTELTTDADGWLSGIENPAEEAVGATYGAEGLMTRLTDPRGGVHDFEHDFNGRLERDEGPGGRVQTLQRELVPDGYKVTLTAGTRDRVFEVHRLATGSVQTITREPGGAETTVTSRLDGSQTAALPDGRTLLSQVGPDPRWRMSVPVLRSLTTTTPGGRTRTMTRTRTATLATPGDPLSATALTDALTTNGDTQTTAYDAATRTLTRTTAAGRASTTRFDADGHVDRIALPGTDPIEMTYDGRGRVAESEQGARRWTFEHDAGDRITARVDALGHRTEFEYDAADRVNLVRSPEGGETAFEYDANGNRTAVVMPDGERHEVGFNGQDRLDRYTAPGPATIRTRTFEPDGRIDAEALAGGRSIDHQYDAAGRGTALAFGDATAGFSYAGATDRLTGTTRTPAGAGDAQGTSAAYDAQLPTTQAATAGATTTGTFTHAYDDDFLLSSTVLASGTDSATDTIDRDDDGLVTSHAGFGFTRGGPGGAVSAIAGNGLASAFGYDAAALPDARSSTVGGTERYGVDITRDAAARITRRVETVAGTAHTYDYAYDDDGRLTGVERDDVVTETYAYDGNGNRTSRRYGTDPAETATYDAQDRLTALGATTYGWTAAGFLATRGADDFSYSDRGELLEADLDGGPTIAYRSDAYGRRVARVEGGDVTRYLYGNPSDPFQVSAVRTPDNVLTRFFYDEQGLLHAMRRGTTWYAIATDQVGSPRVITSAGGTVERTIDYDAFGRVVASTGSLPMPFGFAGGIADEDTELVRFGLRDYDPEAGRWTARDPALYEGGQANLYVYVSDDPVARRDPTGLWCVGGSVYGGVGAGAQVCSDEDGISICVEAGFGAGAGADIDLQGGSEATGSSLIAEASAKFGPLGGKIGAELDGSGCLSVTPEVELGPIKLSADGVNVKAELDVEFDGVNELVKSGKGSVQAKIAGKICRRF